MQPLAIVDGFLPLDSCLAQGHIGTFASQSLYLPTTVSPECAFENVVDVALDAGTLVTIPDDVTSLVWISEVALDDELLAKLKPENPWGYMDDAFRSVSVGGNDEQQALLEDRSPLLYRTPSASLLAFRGHTSERFALDSVLAPYHKVYDIPYPPTSLVPVPADDVARVGTILSGLKYNRSIAHLVDGLSIPQMHKDITWLTGEASDSLIESRHSFHPDARKAAHWILDQMESTGATCALRPFLPGFTPNVIWYFNILFWLTLIE